MKLLVLGGTKFLGRHAVDAALAADHEVTLFTRGQTNPELFPEVEHLHGDRDGDLLALDSRTWDGVVDSFSRSASRSASRRLLTKTIVERCSRTSSSTAG